MVNYYGKIIGGSMTLIIKIGKFCLRLLYGVLKIFPVKKNKVLFLSRQSDELSLDFSMLKTEWKKISRIFGLSAYAIVWMTAERALSVSGWIR